MTGSGKTGLIHMSTEIQFLSIGMEYNPGQKYYYNVTYVHIGVIRIRLHVLWYCLNVICQTEMGIAISDM